MPKWYLFDALGSTIGITDADGALVASKLYDAFGNVLAETGTDHDPYHYVGAYGYCEEPELPIALLWHRWYEKTTGRFVSRDPIARQGGRTYAYARGEPTGRRDARGLWDEGDEGVGAGISDDCGTKAGAIRLAMKMLYRAIAAGCLGDDERAEAVTSLLNNIDDGAKQIHCGGPRCGCKNYWNATLNAWSGLYFFWEPPGSFYQRWLYGHTGGIVGEHPGAVYLCNPTFSQGGGSHTSPGIPAVLLHELLHQAGMKDDRQINALVRRCFADAL